MVDKQIQDLVADTTPASGDTVETQKVGGGAGSSKQVTIDDVITQAAPVATGSVKGVMSAADKTLVDSSLFFSKVDATVAPAVTDDSNSSYEVGSVWIDVTADKAYVCLDASVGAAVWTETTQTGGGGGAFQYVAVLEKTALYTILSADAGKLLTASGTFTLTLPTSLTNVGQDFIDIINIGTGSITVSAGTDGINVLGNDTLVLGPGELARLTYAAAADPKWRARTADYSLLSSGAGAPSSTPSKVGEIYVDTTNDVAYIATGTASSADWKQSSGEAVTGTSAQMIVYDVSGDIQSVTITGDISVSNTGVVTVVDANIDHGSIGGLADDDHSQYTTNSSGAVTPVGNQTPVRVGEIYVDIVLDTAWVAIGTANTDWEQIDVSGNALSTGLRSGGVVSINTDTSKFDITAGTGIVVDNHTDPSNPVITTVSWGAFTAEAHLATLSTAIGINSSGAVVTQSTLFTQDDLRDTISLALATHTGGLTSSAIEVIGIRKLPSFNPMLALSDLINSEDAINRSGNVFSANGVNLKIDKTAGEMFALGGNIETSAQNPNILTISSASPSTLLTLYQDGVGGFIISAPHTDVDPDFWDSGTGTLVAVPAGQHQAKLVYLSQTGVLVISYGQALYNTQAAAVGNAANEDRVISPNLSDGAFLGYLVVESGATDLSDGTQAVFIQGDSAATVLQEYAPLGNGSTVESVDTSVTSNGTIITITVQQQGGGDLTCILGARTIIYTAGSIALTAGTDAVPQNNYVYIVETGGAAVLTISTSGFPTTEDFVPLAHVLVQTAAKVLADGPLHVHQWTDHIANGISNGHLSHINAWIREQNATWVSGAAGVISITPNGGAPDNVFFSNTAGEVRQLHEHVMPARDMNLGDEIYVANGDGTTIADYDQFADLNGILTDENNATLSGRYFNLVFWAAVSEDEADCKIFVNLPLGSYNSASNATNDVDKLSTFTLPHHFKGTAFLIGRQTLRHQTSSSGTWTDVSYESLLGTLPNNIAGSGQAGITDHGGLSGLLDDDHTQYSLISSGAGAPGSTPTRVGETYVDTTGDITYHSTDTASSADWKISTNAAVDAFKYVAVEEKTANYTVLTTDDGKLFTGSGTFTFELPTTLPALGQDFVDFVNIGSGVITIDAGVSGINQASNDTMTLGPGEATRLTYASTSDPKWRASNDTVSLVSSGAGAPGTTPLFVGQTYIDTTADVAYISVGTASSADWARVLNDLIDDTTPQLGGTLDANGNPIAMGDAELQRPNIKDYSVESTVATDGATVTLDLAADGNDQTLTLTQNITLAFSNWPPTGTLGKVTFQCTQDSDTAKTVTVTNVDKWPEGTAWVMSTGLDTIDEVVFWSRDAGTTVYGAVIGQAFA